MTPNAYNAPCGPQLHPKSDLGGAGLGIASHAYDHERQFYTAGLDAALTQGETYVLAMDFQGYLNDQLHGFYRSSYVAEDGTDK